MSYVNLPNGDSILSTDIAGVRCRAPHTCSYLGLQPAHVQIKHMNSTYTGFDLPTYAHAQMWTAMLNAVTQLRVTL